MWYKNIAGRFFGLVTKHASDGQTDGRTDVRTELRLQRPRQHSSRGKKIQPQGLNLIGHEHTAG